MNVLIRADASAESGGGHIGRCLALAEAVRERGGTATFATCATAALGRSMLAQTGFPVHVLDCKDDWQSDAHATRVHANAIDWIVVDHYGLDARWQTIFKDEGIGVLVLDDLANRPHACDILVDTGRPEEGSNAYDSLVSDNCIRLLGPHYLVLRREFRETPSSPKEKKKTTDLLVFFGSTDGASLTGRSLDAIDRVDAGGDLTTHVLLSKANARYEEILNRGGIVVHENVSDMAGLLADMDIAIGAGGVSMWERCRMGVPSLTVALNDNQVPGVRLALSAGAIRSFALNDARDPASFSDALSRFFESRQNWPAIAAAGRQMVDGNGAARIVDRMVQ